MRGQAFRRTRLLVGLMAAAALTVPPATAVATTTNPTPGEVESPGARAADWPQFLHGRFHQGQNAAETVLSPSTVAGLHVGWSARMAPSGFFPSAGTASVSGGTVYVGGGDVRAFDADSGQLRWRASVPGGVVTTPAVAAGLVVVATADPQDHPGSVVALDASTGARRWTQRLRGMAFSSPTIARSHVYVATTTGHLYSIALLSGRVKWVVRTEPRPDLGRPSAPTVGGGRVFVNVQGGTRTVALDAATGARLWSRTISEGGGAGVDAFTVAYQGSPPAIYAGGAGGDVVAMDPATGEVKWHRSFPGPVFSPVVLASGSVYVNYGPEVALDAATGATRWTLAAPESGFFSYIATTANGVLYLPQLRTGAQGNRVSLLTVATSTGRRLAELPLPFEFDPPFGPSISAGRLYLVGIDADGLVQLRP